MQIFQILFVTSPIFFLPFISNNPLVSRQLLYYLAIVFLFLTQTIKLFKSRTIKLEISPLLVGITFFVLSYIFSTIFASANKTNSFIFETGTVIVCYFIYLKARALGEQKISFTLVIASLAASVFYILQKIFDPFLPTEIQSTAFAIAGSSTTLLTLTLIGLSISIDKSIKSIKTPQNTNKYIKALLMGVILVIQLFSLLLLLPKLKGDIEKSPSTSQSWYVTLESLKNNPVLGIGSSEYITAYNLYRPVSTNSDKLWSLRFNYAQNLPLHISTINGLFGLISLVLVILLCLKQGAWTKPGVLISLALVVVAIPKDNFYYLLLFTVLAFVDARHDRKTVSIKLIKPSAFALGLMGLALLGITSFYFINFTLSEFYTHKTIEHLNKGEALKAYQTATTAVELQPTNEDRRTMLANISLTLGEALSKKTELSVSDRQTVTQLLTQSVNQNQLAVNLNKRKASTWHSLGLKYAKIINLSPTAEEWVIRSLIQSQQLDPLNPLPYADLGHFYLLRLKYKEAITEIQKSIAVYGKIANSHYILGLAYKADQQNDKAFSSFAEALKLANESDKSMIQKEIDGLKPAKPLALPTHAPDKLIPLITIQPNFKP